MVYSNIVKRIKSSSQKEIFKPIKVYCYKSISSSITNILSCPGMLGVCEQWREEMYIMCVLIFMMVPFGMI